MADYEDTYVDFVRSHYDRNVAQVVSGIRALADRVEEAAVPGEHPSAAGIARFTYASQQVHHELVWGMANLASYHIIGAAAAVDNAEREQS